MNSCVEHGHGAARGTLGTRTSTRVGAGCPATEMLHAVSPWRKPAHVMEAWEDRLKSSSNKLFQVTDVESGCSVTSSWLRVSDVLSKARGPGEQARRRLGWARLLTPVQG